MSLAAAFAAVASSAQAADPYVIGLSAAMSGGASGTYSGQAAGMRLYFERVNAAGGITVGGKKLKVELARYDYQSDGQRAAQATQGIDLFDLRAAEACDDGADMGLYLEPAFRCQAADAFADRRLAHAKSLGDLPRRDAGTGAYLAGQDHAQDVASSHIRLGQIYGRSRHGDIPSLSRRRSTGLGHPLVAPSERPWMSHF